MELKETGCRSQHRLWRRRAWATESMPMLAARDWSNDVDLLPCDGSAGIVRRGCIPSLLSRRGGCRSRARYAAAVETGCECWRRQDHGSGSVRGPVCRAALLPWVEDLSVQLRPRKRMPCRFALDSLKSEVGSRGLIDRGVANARARTSAVGRSEWVWFSNSSGRLKARERASKEAEKARAHESSVFCFRF